MGLIQNISSILKTWVFKNRILKFSSRYERDAQSCFYCPEMCRFSCPVSETLKHSGVTPRGKMSLLHLSERGMCDTEAAGSAQNRLWYLDQCTGCGRCTEYCLHEIDVASNLRAARGQAISMMKPAEIPAVQFGPVSWERPLRKLLIAEAGRKEWWRGRPLLLEKIGVAAADVVEWELPQKIWSHRGLPVDTLKKIGEELKGIQALWVESPEVTWFLQDALKGQKSFFRGEVHSVWQALFNNFLELDLGPNDILHESYHLTRLLPRTHFSVPMYQKGFMPFHSGWNVLDCGGEGHYRDHYPKSAQDLARRVIEDFEKSKASPKDMGSLKIICQSQNCVKHLATVAGKQYQIIYWLDLL